MFMFDGKDVVNGAVKRLSEIVSGINPNTINEWFTTKAEQIPVLGIFVQGYEAMTPEEKAEFAKNIMLAGAALAAKNGGKVSF